MVQKKTKKLVTGAIIAALYVVLTFLANACGLASGVIQVRISEALNVLVCFTGRGGSGSNGWLSACQSLDRRRYLGCHFRNACFVYRRVWRLSASQKSHFGTFVSGTFQCAYCAVCVEICIWRTRRFLVLICISCHW